MEGLEEIIGCLPRRRQVALQWFVDRAGEEHLWPKRIILDRSGGLTHLASKAKGIYKPKWSEYTLSVGQVLGGPYPGVYLPTIRFIEGVPMQPDSQPLQEELAGNEREELQRSRIADTVIKRIHSELAIFGVAIAALGVGGLFAFGKYIEFTLSDSISRSVNATASTEISKITQSVPGQVETEVRKLDQRLVSIETGVAEAQRRAERTLLETEVKLRGTIERVEHMGRLLVEDVEKRRREFLSELGREVQKFDEARREALKQSSEILEKMRREVANLERLTTLVRAPLREKITSLAALRLEKSAPDADIHRYHAILVLKELEDAEVVNRERAMQDARRLLVEILGNDQLRDDFYVEVRLRAIRAVGELELGDLAVERAVEAGSWERRSFILLLGALEEVKAIGPLMRIVKNRREPVDIRDAGIRALGAIRGRSPRPFELWSIKTSFLKSREQAEDPEIQGMRPRRRGPFRGLKIPEEEALAIVSEVSSILADKREPVSLRLTALRILNRMEDSRATEAVRRVLLDEWRDYGEDAISFFAGIPAEASIGALREFVLRGGADKSLRRRALNALIAMEMRAALPALREIAEMDPDDELRAMAAEGAKKLSGSTR